MRLAPAPSICEQTQPLQKPHQRPFSSLPSSEIINLLLDEEKKENKKHLEKMRH
jgi:hypothetical protein